MGSEVPRLRRSHSDRKDKAREVEAFRRRQEQGSERLLFRRKRKGRHRGGSEEVRGSSRQVFRDRKPFAFDGGKHKRVRKQEPREGEGSPSGMRHKESVYRRDGRHIRACLQEAFQRDRKGRDDTERRERKAGDGRRRKAYQSREGSRRSCVREEPHQHLLFRGQLQPILSRPQSGLFGVRVFGHIQHRQPGEGRHQRRIQDFFQDIRKGHLSEDIAQS